MSATLATDSRRLTEMRARILARKRLSNGGAQAPAWDEIDEAKSLRQSETLSSWQRRRGRLAYDRLAQIQFKLDELDLLVGRPDSTRPARSPEELEQAKEYLRRFPGACGQTGHCEPDYPRLLQRGLPELRDDLAARAQATAGETADFYLSVADALEGFAQMIAHAAEAAEAALAGATGERREELAVMAASCRRLLAGPPATFRDALQAIWFVWLGLAQAERISCIAPGHLDRTLKDFFQRDVSAGILTEAQALLLIENFYLLINDCWGDGSAIPVMVGGRDAEGRDLTNRLSYLCLEALRRTNLVYPTVGICWHEATPAALTGLAVELIAQGYTTPAFFGDETIRRGLIGLGVPPAEAGHYINSTCVEITPVAASNVWVASPYFSTCRLLLEEITAQAEMANEAPSPTFTEFLAAYRRRLAAAIASAAANLAQARVSRRLYGRKPLQSLFTHDCLARGRDIDDGGALYNWVECSFVGLANLADSLYVVREEVYEKRRLSLRQLREILQADFVGHEPERRRFLQGLPKYGQNDARVDQLFAETLDFVRAECARHTLPPDNAPFVPGAFCWVMHERLGGECGATPDGRRAGTPFADGCGPAQGRETCGPTAAILSTTSWNHSPLIGGLAFNMKFSRALFAEPGAVERLRDLILTYLRRGGFETQVNVVDNELLRRARENPDHYRDLVVRIGGYTDYFTRLSPQMQDELLLRTEYAQV